MPEMPRSDLTLLNLENRLAALKQDKKYNPKDPWWVLFSSQEIEQVLGKKPEEA